MLLDMQDVECPYCGELISLMLDASAGSQRYIEDCHVCCRPITVMLDVDADGDTCVSVQSQDDA
ncbi:CPXCG motif-containing cysteine-rich protein [Thermomonas sp.]|uniref:CPXCG motif-containing cysteine-rich protein n=1 Tax=Thermomonas sp. TaxID=1971895 RepID=UPI0024881751|nr:CPXCG motif-containing cysteine-rich protein [Thermomonas sp.]MDI1254077.1 CPXCG motif-containing cysteine-rich protein [Thermomonas sp.]